MPNMPPTPVNRRKNINMNQLTLSPPNRSLFPDKVTPMFPGGDKYKYHPGHLFQESQPILINVHLRAVLHEDEHLLSVDLHPEVVDQVGMVDRLEDP